jgi:hypothetical protein
MKRFLAVLVLIALMVPAMGWRCGPRDIHKARNLHKTQTPSGLDLEGVTVQPGNWPVSTPSNTFSTFYNTTFTSQDGMWTEIYADGVLGDILLHHTTSTFSFSTTYWDPWYGTTSTWLEFSSSSYLMTNAYDSFGFLHLNDGAVGQPYDYEVSLGAQLEDSGQELSLPTKNRMGLNVKRKVYANQSGSQATRDNFIRWLEILTNNTAAPVTVNVVIGGSSYSSRFIMETSDGDSAFSGEGDNWILSRDYAPWGPYLGHLMDGTMFSDGVDNVVMATSGPTILNYWTTGWTTTPYLLSTMTITAMLPDVIQSWSGVTLNPGETKVLMHLEIMSDNHFFGGDLAAARQAVTGLETAPAKVIAGMDADEINAVFNWPAARNNCNVTAAPGAAPAGRRISVTTLPSGQTAQTIVLLDGSFGVCIDAASGDSLRFTLDGQDVGTITVP